MPNRKKFPISTIDHDSHRLAGPPASRHAATAGSCILAAVLVASPMGAAAQMAATDTGNTAQASTFDIGSRPRIGIKLGFNSGYKKAMLAYETPDLWHHRLSNGHGRLTLNLELGVSYWNARQGHPDNMWQLSAIPIMRWWPNDGFYLEAGVGPTLVNHTRFAGYEISTLLQFGSYLGAGVLINGRHRLGLHYSHYSNANIKKPNPGLDLIQATYTYAF